MENEASRFDAIVRRVFSVAHDEIVKREKEYIEKRFPEFSDGRTRYAFTDPTPANGCWSADIIIETADGYDGGSKCAGQWKVLAWAGASDSAVQEEQP